MVEASSLPVVNSGQYQGSETFGFLHGNAFDCHGFTVGSMAYHGLTAGLHRNPWTFVAMSFAFLAMP